MERTKEDKRGLFDYLQEYLHEYARSGKETEVAALKFKWNSASRGTVILEDPARSQFKLDEEELDVLLTNYKL